MEVFLSRIRQLPSRPRLRHSRPDRSTLQRKTQPGGVLFCRINKGAEITRPAQRERLCRIQPIDGSYGAAPILRRVIPKVVAQRNQSIADGTLIEKTGSWSSRGYRVLQSFRVAAVIHGGERKRTYRVESAGWKIPDNLTRWQQA